MTGATSRSGRFRLAFVGIAIAVVSSGAWAQSPARQEAARYPTKPIRFVVPSSVGGGNGVLVPAKTPQTIIDTLNAEIVRILRLPETRAQLETLGFDVIGTTPDEFTAFAKRDLAKWAKTLKEAGIKPEL